MTKMLFSLRRKLMLLCIMSIHLATYAHSSTRVIEITPFVTTWQTDLENGITIPINADDCDFTVDWGDGTEHTITGSINNINHTYTTEGVKTVSITPNIPTGFPRIVLSNTMRAEFLLTVESWGSGQWGNSLESAFNGARNLEINATDVPDFSLTTNFNRMFERCYNLTGNTGFANWILNTSPSESITFVRMFFEANKFNGDISNWDVSGVTDMTLMFQGAIAFNQDIGNWNMSNVTNTFAMFQGASAFNQDIGYWNMSKVTNTYGMFDNASAFNQDISNWDVSAVTNMMMMFRSAVSFNQDISSWNVSNVTQMPAMFYGATAFDQDLGSWDIGNVSDMSVFLFNGKLSRINYDNTLRGWSTLDAGETNIPSNLNVHFGASNYSNNSMVVDARTDLTGSRSWVITDGGMVSVLTTNGELSGSYMININKNGGLGGSAGLTKNGKIVD